MKKSSNAPYALNKRQSLPDELAQIITRQIDDDEYLAGDVLPSEQALAEYFKVSRTVVREALARLKSEGLILSKRGSGPIVCERAVPTSYTLNIEELSKDELRSFIEFRLVVEGENAALAALRRTDEHVEHMEQCLCGMEQAIAASTSGTTADYQFHCLLAAASGNPYLAEFSKFIAAKLWLGVYRARWLSNQDPSSALLVLNEHKAILSAIQIKDSTQARRALQGHLIQSARRQGIMVDIPCNQAGTLS